MKTFLWLKRKIKKKGVEIFINPVNLIGMEEAMRGNNILNAKLVVLREKELKN